MIDFSKTKPGDKLRIVGAGAPGFAKLGDVVTVTSCNGTDRCYAVNDAGEHACFALTCGAARGRGTMSASLIVITGRKGAR